MVARRRRYPVIGLRRDCRSRGGFSRLGGFNLAAASRPVPRADLGGEHTADGQQHPGQRVRQVGRVADRVDQQRARRPRRSRSWPGVSSTRSPSASGPEARAETRCRRTHPVEDASRGLPRAAPDRQRCRSIALLSRDGDRLGVRDRRVARRHVLGAREGLGERRRAIAVERPVAGELHPSRNQAAVPLGDRARAIRASRRQRRGLRPRSRRGRAASRSRPSGRSSAARRAPPGRRRGR